MSKHVCYSSGAQIAYRLTHYSSRLTGPGAAAQKVATLSFDMSLLCLLHGRATAIVMLPKDITLVSNVDMYFCKSLLNVKNGKVI